jgi:hypothetical protein
MAYVIKCNACSHRIPWKPTDKAPMECPKCWASFGEERDDSDVVMPFIRSPKTTQNDKLYRDMEKGSETRMQIAAEQTGAPIAEMSAMKMTDMKDNLREGDISAKLVPDANDGKYFQPGSNGAEYMAGNAQGAVTVNGVTQMGVVPRAGASAVSSFRNVMGQGPWNVATVK